MYLLFNKWTTEGIKVNDPGLVRYVLAKSQYVPISGGRHSKSTFHRSQISVVERLINKIMITGHKRKKHTRSSGHFTGKKTLATLAVFKAFNMIEEKTKRNPVEVFVEAINNSAPRDEIITIEYGGARYPQSVECAPQRRVDLALRWMVQGSYARSFKTKKKLYEILAKEIMDASQENKNSNAINSKYDLERQADSAR